jgi:hypothetical protein
MNKDSVIALILFNMYKQGNGIIIYEDILRESEIPLNQFTTDLLDELAGDSLIIKEHEDQGENRVYLTEEGIAIASKLSANNDMPGDEKYTYLFTYLEEGGRDILNFIISNLYARDSDQAYRMAHNLEKDGILTLSKSKDGFSLESYKGQNKIKPEPIKEPLMESTSVEERPGWFKRNSTIINTLLAIVGLIVAIVVMVFGNDLWGKYNQSYDSKMEIESILEYDKSDVIGSEKGRNINEEVIGVESYENYINRVSKDILSFGTDTIIDELIKEKSFKEAIDIIDLAKTKTIQKDMLASLESRKKSILLMMEYDFDDVYFSFPANVILTQKNEKFGLFSRGGKELIKPQFDAINPIVLENLLISENDGRIGLISKDGEIKFQPIFDVLEPDYFNPLILVEENGKSGFLDQNGKIVVPVELDQVMNKVEGLIICKSNAGWGGILLDGSKAIPMKYDTIFIATNSMLMAEEKGVKTFFNLKGEVIKNPAFD